MPRKREGQQTEIAFLEFIEGGGLSRFVIVSWEDSKYNKEIADSITSGLYRKDEGYVRNIQFDFPEDPVKVILPRTLAEKIQLLSETITEDLNEDFQRHGIPAQMKGRRLQKRLVSLAKAADNRNWNIDTWILEANSYSLFLSNNDLRNCSRYFEQGDLMEKGIKIGYKIGYKSQKLRTLQGHTGPPGILNQRRRKNQQGCGSLSQRIQLPQKRGLMEDPQ
jgi:hypothetical protein